MLNWATGPLIIGWIFVLIWVPIVVMTQKKTHPKALFTLFFAELWERFSFYGMRALLTLYMTQRLFDQMEQGEADARALGIYGAFNALLYGAPVVGGLLADRLLGFRRSVIIGGLFMAIGQFVLSGTIGQEWPFFIGLALIIIGNGYFKPNISSFLGTFYEQDDARKDGAFTIFYMGINIGAFLSPLTCGYLGARHGWSYGFLAAGIGICLGVFVFWRNMRVYGEKGGPPEPEKLKGPAFMGMSRQTVVLLCTLLTVPLFAGLLDHEKVVDWILVVAGILIIGFLIVDSLRSEDKEQGQRQLVVVVLFFFHMIFWALFEQAGGSLTLLTERNVSRYGIPTAQFQALNPFYIMILAPVFSWIWIKLRSKKKEPRTPMKFVLGLVQMALGYWMIVIGAQFADGGMVPLLFLCLMYLFHTTGELSLSPVGLSVVTKLSTPKAVGFVMGAWFLSIAFAHKIAGELGKLTTADSAGDTIGADGQEIAVDSAEALTASLQGYTDVYMTWGVYVVLGSAAVLLLLSPILKRWMHGIH